MKTMTTTIIIWLKHSLKLVLLLLFVCFQSCDISKRALKNKTDRELTESTETAIKRKGDTVTYTVPKIVLKDTTIYTVNRQGTTLRTVYNNEGQISQIDCFASMIDEITKSNRQLVEAIKEKDSEKTETFDSAIVIYIMLGFALIVFIVAYLGFRMLNKNANAISLILDKIK